MKIFLRMLTGLVTVLLLSLLIAIASPFVFVAFIYFIGNEIFEFFNEEEEF